MSCTLTFSPCLLRKKGLTLVELLLVIGIIALLIGITWTVLAHAREKARQITCTSNLKQVWIALQAYREDYDGIDPDGSPREYWELGLPPEIFLLLTAGYIEDAQVVRCPNDPFNAVFSYWSGWWSGRASSGMKFSEWIAKQDTSFAVILDGYHDYRLLSFRPWEAKDGRFFMLWATLDGAVRKGCYDLPWDNLP